MEDILKKLGKDLTKDWTEEDWCKMEENSVRDAHIKKIIIDIINKARELDWIQHVDHQPFIHLADVEKLITGILNPKYINYLVKIKRDGSNANHGLGGKK